MKKIYCLAVVLLLMHTFASAQIAAGILTPSVISKTNVAPVQLTASFINNAAALTWQSPGNITILRYQLEKSVDGENYSYISSFAGSDKTYSTTDNNLFENNTYYRLKIIDAAGNFAYSQVVVVNPSQIAAGIKLLPTQIDQKVFIWVPAHTSISKASVTDAAGRVLTTAASITNTTNIAAVATNGLPAGFYNLILQTNKGEIIKLKFNKES